MLIPFGVFSAAGAGGDSGGGSFDLISTTLLTGSQASVTFDVSSLASTYKHLQIRATYRANSNLGGDNPELSFNADTTYTNYRSHWLLGNGSTVSSSSVQSTNYRGIVLGTNLSDAGAGANQFSGFVADILDPFSTTKNKTVRSLSGGTSYNYVNLTSGLWMNTAATTSLMIRSYPGDATNLLGSGSRFSLYGIKG